MFLKIADHIVSIEFDQEMDAESFKQATLPYTASGISRSDFSINVSLKPGLEEKLQKLPSGPVRLNSNPANATIAIVSSRFISHISWAGKLMQVSIDTHSRHPALLVLENLKLLVSLLCIQKGGLPCHSSALSKNDSAIAFVGNSGSGKTTIASLLSKSWNLIDDDFNIFLPANGSFFIHSTPFYLLSSIRKPKHALSPIQLKKIFVLQKGLITKTTPLSFQRKYIIMIGNTFAFSVNSDFGDTVMDNSRRLCETVPIANLFFCKTDDITLKMPYLLQE